MNPFKRIRQLEAEVAVLQSQMKALQYLPMRVNLLENPPPSGVRYQPPIPSPGPWPPENIC